jgi:competence protein ComEA
VEKEQYRWLLIVLAFVVLLGVVVLFRVMRPQPPPIIIHTATPPPSPEPTPTVRPARVYVSGAVLRPDVYTLGPDSIVKDAILAAGGPTQDADLDRINLALPVVDGQQIYVPRLDEGTLPVQPASRLPTVIVRVNINTADLMALDSLPGIGPAIAQRILDYREAHGPFSRIEDITNVPGIGPATLENLRDLISTE